MPSTSRRTFLRLGCTAGALALSGCVDSLTQRLDAPADRQVTLRGRPAEKRWPREGYGPANTGYNPHASPPRSDPTELWRQSVDGAVSSVVVGPERVYASSNEETVAVARDGALEWRLDAGGPLGLVAGRLYAAGDGVTAIRPATGDRIWEQTLDEFYVSTVYEARGTVYAAGTEAVYGLHADTGTQRWRLSTSRDPTLVAGEAAVYLVTDERVRELAPGEQTNGVLDDPAPVSSRTIRTGWRPRVQSPSLVDGSLYVPRYGDRFHGSAGSVRRFGLRSGDERWLTPFRWQGVGPVSVTEDTVYAAPYRATTEPPDGSVVALDGETGRERWRYDGQLHGRPAVGDGVLVSGGADPGSPTVCVSSTGAVETDETETPTQTTEERCSGGASPAATGTLHAFDAASGAVLWKIRPGGSFGEYPVALVEDRVYYGDADGLHALA